MGLRDIQIKRTTVPYAETSVSVRGISTADLMVAMQDYAPEMAIAFASATGGDSKLDIKAAISSVAKEVPDLVGAAIALASDEYDDAMVKTATQLPFPVQIELVEAIFHNTFASEADVKKLLESLTRMFIGTSGALKEVMGDVSLLAGIGGLGGKPAS